MAILYIFLHTKRNEDGNGWNKVLNRNLELKDLIGLPEKIFEINHSNDVKLMMIDSYLDVLFYTKNNYSKSNIMNVIIYYVNNLLDGDIEKHSSIICSILGNINKMEDEDRESAKPYLKMILMNYIEKVDDSILL